MQMQFEKYFDSDYQFTPSIHELAVVLKDVIKTDIIGSLLGKLNGFNENAEIKKECGKEYHFYYNMKTIAESELGIDYKTIQRHIKALSKMGLITTFSGRNKEGYNTTYFLIHLDVIKALFNKGRAMLGRKVKAPEVEKQTDNSRPATKKHSVGKVRSPPYKRATTTDTSQSWVQTAVKKLNEYQVQLDNGKLKQAYYFSKVEPLKAQLKNQKIIIKFNKNKNLWEV